jgi:hypothetical protein
VAARADSQALCYSFSTMETRPRRPGKTETFSVSVDAATKAALRELADSDFGGNLSALIVDFAEDARRRTAAAAYLVRHDMPKLTLQEAKTLERAIQTELSTPKRRAKKRAA